MEHTVAHLLPDEPLLLHLQAGDTIIFVDLAEKLSIRNGSGSV
jgi:hypothetical protein